MTARNIKKLKKMASKVKQGIVEENRNAPFNISKEWRESEEAIASAQLMVEDDEQSVAENLADLPLNLQSNPETHKKKGPIRTICIPTSVIESVQTNELQVLVIAQICRIFALFRINKIIVFDDQTYRPLSSAFNPSEFIIKVMTYLETPQYLRKKLFPISATLRNIGYALPLDCSHHLRESDVSAFREGVVERRPTKPSDGSWVDIGLNKGCKLDRQLEEGTRVTVRIEDYMFPHRKFYKGTTVSPLLPQYETGVYWGYNVHTAVTFSEIFSQISEKALRFLVSPDCTEKPISEIKDEIQNKLNTGDFDEVLIFFTGKSLKSLFDADEKTKIDFETLKSRFCLKINPLLKCLGTKSIYLQEQLFYFCSKIFD